MTELVDLARHVGRDAAGLASAVEILLRVTVVLSAAMLLVVALRRSSAAVRHLVWTLSLVGTLLVPIGYWAFPGWHWAILPPAGALARGGRCGNRVARAAGCSERPSDALPAESREPFDPATMPETMPPILGPVAAPERPSAAARCRDRDDRRHRRRAGVVLVGGARRRLGDGDVPGVGVAGRGHRRGVARRAACGARGG